MNAIGRPKSPRVMIVGGMGFSEKYSTKTATSERVETIAKTTVRRDIQDTAVEVALT